MRPARPFFFFFFFHANGDIARYALMMIVAHTDVAAMALLPLPISPRHASAAPHYAATSRLFAFATAAMRTYYAGRLCYIYDIL